MTAFHLLRKVPSDFIPFPFPDRLRHPSSHEFSPYTLLFAESRPGQHSPLPPHEFFEIALPPSGSLNFPPPNSLPPHPSPRNSFPLLHPCPISCLPPDLFVPFAGKSPSAAAPTAVHPNHHLPFCCYPHPSFVLAVRPSSSQG